jgi:inosine-uridine nucleoside N-ribohydrolase/formylmethanofuran dehydrogenase subunit E
MNKVKIILVIIFSSFNFVFSQQNYHVIIDTDCAMDDLRAISIILSRPEFKVEGFIASCGTLDPHDGMIKIKSLLHEFSQDKIPVACGENFKNVNPPWRAFSKNLWWGDFVDNKAVCSNANDLLKQILSTTNDKITLVCLSNLNSIYTLIKSNPELLEKIDKIVWYNDGFKPLSGFNYECDKKSAEEVLQTKIRIDVISNLSNSEAIFDNELLNAAINSNTLVSKVLAKAHNNPEVQKKVCAKEYTIWDELTVIFMLYPEIFDMNPNLQNVHTNYCTSYNVKIVRNIYKDILNGKFKSEKNIVFNQFPENKEMFMYDVQLIMDSALLLYGKDEWKACVMTDEFHGHLGIYSIVGAKMGIFARDYFGVGIDKMEVLSFAGIKPPYSCLNDGLQVSTGATLGRGTISISGDSITLPQAIFTCNGKKIKIRLKEKYNKIADDDINAGIIKYGILDNGYWKLVRKNALEYWLNWNRNEIFDVQIIN